MPSPHVIEEIVEAFKLQIVDVPLPRVMKDIVEAFQRSDRRCLLAPHLMKGTVEAEGKERRREVLRCLLQFEHLCAFFGMRAFLHVVYVPLCFVNSSEGWKEALPPFESGMATVGRMVS